MDQNGPNMRVEEGFARSKRCKVMSDIAKSDIRLPQLGLFSPLPPFPHITITSSCTVEYDCCTPLPTS